MSVASLIAALAIFLAPVSERSRVEFTEDTLEDVMENLAEERAVLVDVRSLEEWKVGHLEGAILLPVTSLRKHTFDPQRVAKLLPPKKEKKILYTFCVVGMRAKAAAYILEQQGYIVRALKPGYDELVDAGFAVAEATDESAR